MFTPTAIERLYFEHENETKGESEEGQAAFSRCEAEFYKRNPEPTLDEQNAVFDAVANYGAVARREGFVDGFKLAVRLLCEVYAPQTTDRKGEQ